MIETGVYFGELHSYHDLELILSGVDIPPAIPKTAYVDVPGADGSIDMTEVHGDVKYNDRDITFTFTAARSMNNSDWEEFKTAVSNVINGKACKITLDKDEDYFYQGRCEIDSYAVDRRIRQIIVRARCKPWKFRQNETVVEVPLTAADKVVMLTNARRTVVPVISCTDDDTKVSIDGATFTLSKGTHKILDIQLREGTSSVTVSGSGVVTFTYQEGEL